jgi:hypothetical protein
MRIAERYMAATTHQRSCLDRDILVGLPVEGIRDELTHKKRRVVIPRDSTVANTWKK